ncbi:MAG TPA: neutral zinc metallopeptidase [Candidatus Limnocylindria bacterium]|nr:neutral zinc metallopeptidase [Candidatus Limnocylindria bacterium]
MTFDPNVRLDPSQVGDRRRGGGVLGGGGGGPVIAGGGGIIGVVLLVAFMLLGGDPTALLDPSGGAMAPVDSAETATQCQTGADANTRDDCRIVGFVNSIQKYWTDEFARRGSRYEPAQTILFSGQVQAACGTASSAVGPFYCPLDKKVYLDLSFFRDMQRLGAKGGPFAEGYVVAHEYGHHVQNLMGLLSQSRESGPGSASVRTELMADCFAGVWAGNAAKTGFLVAPTDAEIAQALDAAAAVGDDRIQKATEGRVSPERWTHGSSEQRQQWFRTGYRTGDMNACDVR